MTTLIPTGTEIYYTGDRANESGFGKITAYESPARFRGNYTVTLTDGRVFKKIPLCSFDPQPGRRFILRSEYEAERKAQFELLKKSIRSLTHDN